MFKEPIAPGIFTAGLISAVIGTELPGPGAIYLSQSLKFVKPVMFGDTITARVEVAEVMRERNRLRLAPPVRISAARRCCRGGVGHAVATPSSTRRRRDVAGRAAASRGRGRPRSGFWGRSALDARAVAAPERGARPHMRRPPLIESSAPVM